MKGPDLANDYFEILLFYKNEMRVRLKSSVFSKESNFEYIVHGEKGSFLQKRSDDQENELVLGTIPTYGKDWMKILKKLDGILHILEENNSWVRTETLSEPGNYMHYYQNIYEHLVFGKDLPSPGSEVIQNMKIIDAALESSEKGRIVDLLR